MIILDDGRKQTCDDCGSDEGFRTLCPYSEDVNAEEVKVILCQECYNSRCMEI